MLARLLFKIRFARLLLVCIGIFSVGVNAQTELKPSPINVSVMVPVEKGTPFWGDFESFMTAVAKDLNMQLTFFRFPLEKTNRFSFIRRFTELTKQSDKPDYIVSVFKVGVEPQLVKLAEQAKIGFVSVNAALSKELYKQIGHPQQHSRYWLAHVAHDNVKAGQQLVDLLVNQAMNYTLPGEQINILGITGPSHSYVAKQRQQGLVEGVKKYKNVNLLEVVHSDWESKKAVKQASLFLKQPDPVDIVWTASDSIAAGVYMAQKTLNKDNAPLIVGGFDWSETSFELLDKGYNYYSLGGHFMDGGWALILLYDHFFGYDIVRKRKGIYNTELSSIDAVNQQQIHTWIRERKWDSVEFTKFTQTHNPDILKNGYKFELAMYHALPVIVKEKKQSGL
ncbi:ABC transporter substrate-binding protein [Catenovulum sediminis]|uniref:ABC transporter substrate-binding protein n=1 Tax=Catenovulum sediminis TaxID=1740262 RepID=UPI0011800950|nr:ABC transporter substrate-binding protein [Catenovulum sediminis]